MKKTLLLSFLALFVLAFSVSACHCIDTDAKQSGNLWGDNTLFGGNTSIDYKQVAVPEGCTPTKYGYTCSDRCDGTTLVEYYCGYDTKTTCNNVSYTDDAHCKMENYTDYGDWTYKKDDAGHYVRDQYGNKIKVYKIKAHKVCEKHEVYTTAPVGNQKIFSKFYQNSTECNQVPEFGVIADAVALVGALGIFVYRRKN
jgi:hypothetical protein